MAVRLSRARALRELAKLFGSGAYVRMPSLSRRSEVGQLYKKGYEVRFVARTWEEVDRIRDLLATAGVRVPQPYLKHAQIVQPVYGREAVESIVGHIKRDHDVLNEQINARSEPRRRPKQASKRGCPQVGSSIGERQRQGIRRLLDRLSQLEAKDGAGSAP